VKAKLRAKDKRLQSTYGVTLEERTRRERHQHRRCIICRKKISECASKVGLHLDHWHALARVKVKIEKLKNGMWSAYNISFTRYGFHLPEKTFRFRSSNKRKAKKYVTQKLKRAANRGLVCWPCNSGLHRWDDLAKLKRAVEYLEKYFKRLKEGHYDFSHQNT
jgi:hypothetical protein